MRVIKIKRRIRVVRRIRRDMEKDQVQKNNPLVRLSLLAYTHAKTTLLIWLALLLAGTAAYTTWLAREGFPAIQVPIAIANGTYFVDDASQIDREITQPLSDVLKETDSITTVQTTAGSNFFSILATFEEDIESGNASNLLREAIQEADVLPSEAQVEYPAIDPSKYLNEYEILTSVYARDGQPIEALEQTAAEVARELEQAPAVDSAEVQSQFSSGVNPQTGQQQTRQSSFAQVGLRDNGDLAFYQSVTIGIKAAEGYDVIELSDAVREAAERVNGLEQFSSVGVSVTADFAPSIETQIESLQSNLLSGLLAVAVVTLLLITWRASVMTAVFMVSVMAVTLLILFLIGYTLNTISLFALVLALGLFVDDATIIVEAIDANRRDGRPPRDTVLEAVRKVAAASFAGTMTTVLVFLPLVFVSGILGEFIRILPVTIIIALLTSLVLSLTLIPFLSRFVLLKNGAKMLQTPVTRGEKWLAGKLGSIPLLARRSRRKAAVVFAGLMFLPLVFIAASGYYASQLKFNIFPPSNDSDQLQLQVRFPQNTTVAQANQVARDINQVVEDTIGSEVTRLAYFESNERSALIFVELVPFTEREIKAPELLDRLEGAFSGFQAASVRANQVDAGPPVEEFPFKVQVFDTERDQAIAAAQAIAGYLEGATVERPNGTRADITATNIANVQDIARKDGRQFVEVQARFDAEDTTALVESAQQLVEEEFGPERLNEFGLEQDALAFDFGQESDNQDSFNSLAIVGPIAILAMFVLLAIQFRSFLQPLLIFMAIPFSFFGVMYGLYITDNPISFFVMVGFFGLIGIAVNNTILLTDYANQEQRTGSPLIESVAAATTKRFRPLLVTSLTTIAALLPLALSDPFWEALAFTIIFGLLSSTLLVLVAFPYYYLVAEVLRRWTKDRFRAVAARVRR